MLIIIIIIIGSIKGLKFLASCWNRCYVGLHYTDLFYFQNFFLKIIVNLFLNLLQ